MEKDEYLISKISPSLTIAAEVIIECSIALKNCSIYDPNHKIVFKSVERAFLKIQNAFNLKLDLKYHFAKNTIIFEQTYLYKKNPIFSRFASSLWDIGITALEFKEGLTKKELLEFISFINEIKNSKKNLTIENSFPHIFIEVFDVSKIVVEKKEEITEEDEKNSKKLWEEFFFVIGKKSARP